MIFSKYTQDIQGKMPFVVSLQCIQIIDTKLQSTCNRAIERIGLKDEAQILLPAIANRMNKQPFAE